MTDFVWGVSGGDSTNKVGTSRAWAYSEDVREFLTVDPGNTVTVHDLNLFARSNGSGWQMEVAIHEVDGTDQLTAPVWNGMFPGISGGQPSHYYLPVNITLPPGKYAKSYRAFSGSNQDIYTIVDAGAVLRRGDQDDMGDPWIPAADATIGVPQFWASCSVEVTVVDRLDSLNEDNEVNPGGTNILHGVFGTTIESVELIDRLGSYRVEYPDFVQSLNTVDLGAVDVLAYPFPYTAGDLRIKVTLTGGATMEIGNVLMSHPDGWQSVVVSTLDPALAPNLFAGTRVGDHMAVNMSVDGTNVLIYENGDIRYEGTLPEGTEHPIRMFHYGDQGELTAVDGEAEDEDLDLEVAGAQSVEEDDRRWDEITVAISQVPPAAPPGTEPIPPPPSRPHTYVVQSKDGKFYFEYPDGDAL